MKLGKSARVLGFVGTALLAVGCGGGGGAKEAETPVDKSPAKAGPAPLVAKEAQDKFNAALDAFNDHDKKSDWSDATCADVAQQFAGAASQQKGGSFSEATYDAGLAYQRCGDDKDAKAQFEKALQNDPSSTTPALSSRSTNTRPTERRRAPSLRSSRRSSTRSFRTFRRS